MTTKARRQAWHWHPAGPVENNPLFAWPPRPGGVLRWYAGHWLRLSELSLFAGLAVALWLLFPLSLDEPPDTAAIAAIYLRNLACLLAVAGGLHLYLYRWRRQGTVWKYDRRFLARDSGRFNFRDQVADNMAWSLLSGLTLWTIYEVGLLWAFATGWAPRHDWSDGPVWFLFLFFALPLWESLHFYWVHRLLHWPPLYRFAHAVHHRNVNPGPWSGLAMHPLEHLIYFSSVLIHLVIPSHPIHLLFHLYVLTLSAVIGHCGFDALRLGSRGRLALGHFHHQLHHRYFTCNYGSSEMPWDVWFGSFDDGGNEARRRQAAG